MWEYLVVDIQKRNASAAMDAYGADGWELVHVEFGHDSFGCVFKRVVA